MGTAAEAGKAPPRDPPVRPAPARAGAPPAERPAMTLVLPFPAIDPVIVEVGPFALRWYALAYIAGILIAWWAMRRMAAAERLWGGVLPPSRAEIDDLVLWATLGVILGGRLGFVLFYNPGHYLAHPAEILAVWQGGMSFHGGLLGVVLAVVLFARGKRYSPLTLFDMIGTVAPVGIFFGRIANFINGELWGRPSDVPWAMVFPGAGPQPRHPSQLYEAALEGVLLFIVMVVLVTRFRALARPGLAAGVFAAGYGLTRSFAEFFRMPDPQLGFLLGGLTMGQLLSVPLLVLGVALAVRALRRRPPGGDPVP